LLAEVFVAWRVVYLRRHVVPVREVGLVFRGFRSRSRREWTAAACSAGICRRARWPGDLVLRRRWRTAGPPAVGGVAGRRAPPSRRMRARPPGVAGGAPSLAGPRAVYLELPGRPGLVTCPPSRRRRCRCGSLGGTSGTLTSRQTAPVGVVRLGLSSPPHGPCARHRSSGRRRGPGVRRPPALGRLASLPCGDPVAPGRHALPSARGLPRGVLGGPLPLRAAAARHALWTPSGLCSGR